MNTLIIPSVSLGNIPQLTVDLLLTTWNAAPSKRLDDTYLHPFISPIDHSGDGPQPNGTSSGLELYHDPVNNISIIQQRSPVITPFVSKFVDEVLVPLASQYERVIILDSSDGGVGDVHQVHSIEDVTSDDLLNSKVGNLSLQDNNVEEMPFSETTAGLVKARGTKAPCEVFISYGYEGDNTHDAVAMASHVAEKLNVDQKEWKSPVSWKGVYGRRELSNAMEDALYG